MESYTFKVNFQPKQSFAQRERHLNQEVQKHIDLLNSRGLIALNHTITNKNDKFATVIFSLQKMVGA
jgi:hypothetical protein